MSDDKTWVVGEFVETVQLQVVCQTLIGKLSGSAREITMEHLAAYGDIDSALRDFYEDSIRKAVEETKLLAGPGGERRVTEGALRNWFEKKLITPAETRGLAYRGAAETEGLANEAVDVLDRAHIIREERRGGGRWYELSHDRFIDPIKESNKDWRLQYSGAVKTQQWLEEAAARWAHSQRDEDLLDEGQLPEADRWLASPEAIELDYNHDVDAFVRESRKNIRYKEEQRRLLLDNAERVAQAARRLRWAVVFLTIVSLLAVATTAFALSSRNTAEKARNEAEKARNEADRLRLEAVASKNSESEQRRLADEQAARAEEAKAEAVMQRTEALKQQAEAVKQKDAAERANLQTRAQAKEADRQRQAAADYARNAQVARKLAEKQEELAKKASETDRLYREALNLSRRGDKQGAVRKFEDAIRIYNTPTESGEPHNPQAVIDTRLNAGAIYLDLKEDEKAEEQFSQVLDGAHDNSQRAWIQLAIGDAYREQPAYSGRRQEAVGRYMKALALYEHMEDKDSKEGKFRQADVSQRIADTYRTRGDQMAGTEATDSYDQALLYYEKAIELYREAGERKRRVEVLMAAAFLTQRLVKERADEEQALRYFEHALAAAEDDKVKILALENIIKSRRAMTQWADADEASKWWAAADKASEQIFELYQKTGDKAGEAQARLDLGLLYLDRNSDRPYLNWLLGLPSVYQSPNLSEQKDRPAADKKKAVEQLRMAAQLFHDVSKSQPSSDALSRSADALSYVGEALTTSEPDEAVKAFSHALARYTEARSAREEVRMLSELAMLEAEAGHKQKAKNYLEQGERSLSQVTDRLDRLLALSGMGAGYAALQDPNAAEGYFQQMLDIVREETASRPFITEREVHRYIGDIYGKRGLKSKAEQYLVEAGRLAQKVGDVRTKAVALSNMGSAYEKHAAALGSDDEKHKYYDQAIQVYELAAGHYRSIGLPEDEARQFGHLARLYRAKGDTRRAEEYERGATAGAKSKSEEPPPPAPPQP